MIAWLAAHAACLVAIFAAGGAGLLVGLAFAGRLQPEHQTEEDLRRIRDWQARGLLDPLPHVHDRSDIH